MSVEDGSASGYAHASDYCEHVETDLILPLTQLENAFSKTCSKCDNTEQNWLCAKCHTLFCGRFARGHMVQHNKETGHSLAFGLGDLSCWCYGCDSYLNHLSIRPVFDAYTQLHVAKFDEEPPVPFGAMPLAGNAAAVVAPGSNIELADEKDEHQGSAVDPEDEQRAAREIEEVIRELGLINVAAASPAVASPAATPAPQARNSTLETVSLEGFADAIRSGRVSKILVLTGAGISVSAGIPDFRTPGTGLYSNLQKYNLPTPEAMFHIDFFKQNPHPFVELAKEMYPGKFKPTPAHFFIRLLADKKLLLRNYTQNIDGLEFLAGLTHGQVIQAHGGFSSAHCLTCRKLYAGDFCKERILRGEIPKCTVCHGLVKPDIVFFGESLPRRFIISSIDDLSEADCLIVMGSSLRVNPFASLVNRTRKDCIRLLINREKVGQEESTFSRLFSGGGFQFDQPQNYRDVFLQSDCDAGCAKLASLLGWEEDLKRLIVAGAVVENALIPPPDAEHWQAEDDD